MGDGGPGRAEAVGELVLDLPYFPSKGMNLHDIASEVSMYEGALWPFWSYQELSGFELISWNIKRSSREGGSLGETVHGWEGEGTNKILLAITTQDVWLRDHSLVFGAWQPSTGGLSESWDIMQSTVTLPEGRDH